MNQDDGRNLRHKARMERKKALIDAKIAEADTDTGILLVLTGNGKGKSSSAFGMVARALGHGMKVGVVQFIKSRTDTGEEGFFSRLPGVEWHVMGDGFTWDTQNREQDIATANAAWETASRMLADPSFDLVVLDEMTYVMKYGYVQARRILDDLLARPEMQHVVVTGRGAPPELLDIADTVTDMQPVKHAFHSGVRAQKGVEW
ncbi:cob(I)yrinic acid a,c-diamide adenosyltransferase [Paludibacterium paludis]|uniref:Corrinoid adenosyltransferase n=1 Tax=Paludibacterium paludis TaxID=1225769 RepID=A0A918NXT2_9NEIS|nr:cob(I)yrinic acid a,c-diamide adenosyltransferase [Paludibacterium paludis]GGY05345.1 cob(I)yrinic acid a,c-diamide adenosyltransferase [Paludibacterium paludis]